MEQSQSQQNFRLVGPHRYVMTNLVYQRGYQKIWNSPPSCLMRQIPLDKVLDSLRLQIKITQSLNHPNILKIFDTFQENGNLYILKQKCDGKIKIDPNNNQQLDDMIKQILTGIHYVQNIKIIHRNLRPASIYTNDGICKLKGFGYAVVLQNQNDLIQGDPHQDDKDFQYRSPQMLRGQKYGMKSDLWSLGVILYELIYDKKPWEANTIQEYLHKIQTQPLKIPYDCKFSPILKQMLQPAQVDRCQWDILYQSVGLYADDKDLTQKLSLMISLTNLGRQPQALQVLQQQMSNLGQFPDDQFDGSQSISKIFFLGVALLLII